MQKVILVFEGLPASGKTTIADILRDRHGFFKVNESQGKFNNLDAVKDQRAVFEDTIEKYKLAKEIDLPVIIDRGYPSMLAWDYCANRMGVSRDLEEKEKWVKDALEKSDLFEPDLYIYFVSNPKISFQRRPRKEIAADLWSGEMGMNHCQIFYEEFFKIMSHSSQNVLSIEASLSPNKTMEIILKCLNQKR